MILLCDQLSRFYYRGKKEAFQYDKIAIDIAKKVVEDRDAFNRYRLIEQLFIIYPFIHSEVVNDVS